MTPTPPPVPTRTRTIITAVRGPVLLITLGALAEIDHTGGVSFWRTWPVLLIVLGIFKLAERAGVS